MRGSGSNCNRSFYANIKTMSLHNEVKWHTKAELKVDAVNQEIKYKQQSLSVNSDDGKT